MEKLRRFISYVCAVGKSWFNIVFLALDILSLVAIYINPTFTYLPILFTFFLFVSFAYSSFLYYENAIGESISIVLKHKEVQRIYRVLEIYNPNSYDISDIEIKAEWKQLEGLQSRNLEDTVTDVNVDIAITSPSSLTVLGSREKIWATEVPHYSKDGKMTVTIQGTRLDTIKPFYYQEVIRIPKESQ